MRTSASTAVKTTSVSNSMNFSGQNFGGSYTVIENHLKAQKTSCGRIDEKQRK